MRLIQHNQGGVAMYVASFYPQPMGGMEMQALRLAQHLKEQGINVTIFTHGCKGCQQQEIYKGIRVVRLYSVLNRWLEMMQLVTSKFRRKKEIVPAFRSETPKATLPYDTSDSGIKINGNLVDLLYYTIQAINFTQRLKAEENSISLIHVHGVPWVSFVGVWAGRRCGVPVLVKESTTIGLKKYDDLLLGRRLRRHVVAHAHFVAISRYIQQVMRQYGIPESRIHYIPNGTMIADKTAKETGEKLNVLFVGNLTQGAAKGLDVLLQAWQTVIKQFPAAVLNIAGKAGPLNVWQQYLCNLGIDNNVVFMGSQNNMEEIFRQTTVFVSPSRREGLSNALLEAMAFGLPCVVTNISGSQDMIKHGVNGLVVEPDNAEQLADAIIEMLSAKQFRDTMRLNAYAKAKETFSFEKVTAEYKRIYATITNSFLHHDMLKNQTQDQPVVEGR